ncbi:hypothetical protein H112_02071 [Trichophyton rubrum D6]|uniref:Zn(2)-C6 fungal-type domain-containing protein n=3 Tax=Trichophyton TaxID=5550 RepID=F2SWB1_TRIRC|nr:uncharacterized protein TERG_06830 [Trichophyton rubrum CBS 118892]EZF25641.1 hypothetical protein H100_02069 [Trichophyton rubrum MR850]EZF44686.1 hypothetical protein H102_02064 [Trichophyton rubrum CBS 100081]EZF55235.1 hypothetical protein H103_02074 [Trichophyton rubrum CBS 288.86]EZF65873.1 hypothetical protein H104_02051 [Trichophyton rubrum CBS 289.86]EZF76571.1 hypothetical protein H105_02083 [Trichophyton soudanense CBS 452.61]EZF87151.1 hypothetical protein H110_02072 [Trichophy
MAAAPRSATVAPRDTQQYALSTGSRPYRSHKVRACDLCRKRKSRCTVDLPGQSCLLCRVQGADCHYGEDKSNLIDQSAPTTSAETKPWSMPPDTKGLKRTHDEMSSASPARNLMEIPPVASKENLVKSTPKAENEQGYRHGPGESVHIVGPVAAADAQVIERYSERSNNHSPDRKTPYNVYSNDPRKPILYTTVSRRRQGLRTTGTPGENQREIIEQVLGPFKHDLVKIFLDKINASFPIFDEEAFLSGYEAEDDSVPPALLCQVYATSLIYWNQSPVLAPHPKPDVRYAVNMAVAALHEEFSAPGLSTLTAALIDLTGRPIFSTTGNAINSGRTVALAHCLGLNRDPSNWKLSRAEKNQRIRLWWGVVIHDKWASYGHGVPPHISRNQYDVPLPTISVLVPQANPTQQRVRTAHCYIALCQLTEILGDLLPLVYGLQPRPSKETSKILRRMRSDLDRWEDSLPDWLKMPQDQDTPSTSGVSSMQLAFLALKMLVCRVELQEWLQEVNPSDNPNTEARRYFQTECRKAAEEIVQFMLSLRKPQYQEFWMSYSSYHLTSTATLLVRSALETSDPEIARSCLNNILSKHTTEEVVQASELNRNATINHHGSDAPETVVMTPYDRANHNDIVDDMMSISGTFGTMDGFPFDMTGIWDVSGLQDQDTNFINMTPLP